MTDPTASLAPHRQRLARLEGFLLEDPSNNALLVDAFETALSCGEWERARAFLEQGLALSVERDAWRLRGGDFWLAQQRYPEAREVLQRLGQAPDLPAGLESVLLHNLAFVDWRLGHPADCIARLAPTLEGLPGKSHAPGQHSASAAIATRALQQLWLQALHHDGQLARAMTWVRQAEDRHELDPRAAAVASLIALDASDFAAAQRWSAVSPGGALWQEQPVEALVTQASLALAARDVKRAIELADAAVALRPDDGRAWSARGLAALLAGDLEAARTAFVRALSTMARHVGTWQGLGWTQILLGDLPAARISFDAALALDRNFAESHGGLAVVLALQQLREEAESHAALALRLDKANVSGRYASALLSGEVEEASDLQRLARHLLGGRAAPLGGDMADWLPSEVAPGSERGAP